MRSALASVPGVDEEDVVIDYQKKTATVRLDGDPTPTPEQLVAALEDTRFSASIEK